MFGLREKSTRVFDTVLLGAAASDEAGRLGHAEVDTDHVLIGLIAVGGVASRLLAGRGVTLDRARTALGELQRHDLADIGIDAPDLTLCPPERYCSGLKPFTPSAAGIAWADAPDSVTVLHRLAAHPQSRSARLLAHLGVLLTAADLTDLDVSPDEVTPAEGWHAAFSIVTPLDRHRIFSMLDDPNRRPAWDIDVSEIEVVDDEHFIGRAPIVDHDPALARLLAHGVDIDVHHHLAARVDQRMIEWRIVFPRRGHTERLRIDLEDADGETRMTLSYSDELRSGLVARVLRWVSEGHLRMRAQAIVQAAS